MFEKRKTLSYKYDLALEMVDYNEERIQYLISHSVIRQNGSFLEIVEQFKDFPPLLVFTPLLGLMTNSLVSFLQGSLCVAWCWAYEIVGHKTNYGKFFATYGQTKINRLERSAGNSSST